MTLTLRPLLAACVIGIALLTSCAGGSDPTPSPTVSTASTGPVVMTPGAPVCSGDTSAAGTIELAANSTPMATVPGGQVHNTRSDEQGATIAIMDPDHREIRVSVGERFQIGDHAYLLVASCAIPWPSGPRPPGSADGIIYLLPQG